MLGVELWGGAKGNSHMGKGHRMGASVYFGHVYFFFFFPRKQSLTFYANFLGKIIKISISLPLILS